MWVVVYAALVVSVVDLSGDEEVDDTQGEHDVWVGRGEPAEPAAISSGFSAFPYCVAAFAACPASVRILSGDMACDIKFEQQRNSFKT